MSSVDEMMDSEALLIGEIPISLNCGNPKGRCHGIRESEGRKGS